MGIEVFSAQLYCNTADVHFGPQCESDEEAEFLKLWSFAVLGGDPRAIERQRKLWQALEDIRNPDRLSPELRKVWEQIKEAVDRRYP